MRWPTWLRRQPATAAAASVGENKPETPAVPQISASQRLMRRYAVDQIAPASLREIQRLADLGQTTDWFELLDDIASDAQMGTLLRSMREAVTGARQEMIPGDGSPRAQEIAAAAMAMWTAIPLNDQLLSDLLDAEYRGPAVIWPNWQLVKRQWRIVEWEAIESRFLLFPDGRTPHIQTAANWQGEPLAPGMWFYRVASGSVVRSGLGWAAAKPWLYKGYSQIDGMAFLEKHGNPHVQVKLPPNVQEGSRELEMAKAAAKSLIVDQIGLVPPGVEVQLLDAIQKAGTVRDVYLAFIAWCDAALAKLFLGQSITTDDQGSTGSLSKAQVGFQVKAEVTAGRARRLQTFLATTLFRPWTRWHFGPDAPAPWLKLCVEPPTDEKAEAETDKLRAEAAKVITRDVGLPVSKRDLYARTGYKPPENDEDAIGGESASAQPPVPPGALAGLGVCPGCGEVIALADAQKKKSWRDRAP